MKEIIINCSRVFMWLSLGTLFFIFRAKKIYEVFNYGVLKHKSIHQRIAFVLMFLVTFFMNVLFWWFVVLVFKK